MALLNRGELIEAIERLGQMAIADDESIDLLIVGGAVMVLEFSARLSTRDMDGIVTNRIDRAKVRTYVRAIAREKGWQDNWLNDAAKGFVTGTPETVILITAPGIQVSRPALEQLLAMKLCAWRDDVDIADAGRLLREINGGREDIWAKIEPYLQRGRELKARYAFEDLWEDRT
jgi:hypothetical protein